MGDRKLEEDGQKVQTSSYKINTKKKKNTRDVVYNMMIR